MARALEGLRVIDFTQMFAGPGTGMYLADQGADVIKIEPPNGGRDRNMRGGGDVDTFLLLNRGKRSVVLDIRTDRGREAVHRLVKRSDIMLVAWPPGQAERLGYGYEAMRELNPRLVYASITGWGPKGPMAMKAGYDRLMQAHTAIMDRNRGSDGKPMVLPFYVADQAIPAMLCYSIMLALWSREKTGTGQRVEVSQLEAQIAIQSLHLVFREDQDVDGSRHASSPSYVFRTQDERYVVLVPILDAEWRTLWEAVGLPGSADEWLSAEEPDDRLVQRYLAERFVTRPAREWLEILESAGVPVAEVLSGEEFINQQQAWANGMFVERQHAKHGQVRMMGVPLRLSGTPGQAGWPEPSFGQHSREILAEIGYSASEIDSMTRDGVIA